MRCNLGHDHLAPQELARSTLLSTRGAWITVWRGKRAVA